MIDLSIPRSACARWLRLFLACAADVPLARSPRSTGKQLPRRQSPSWKRQGIGFGFDQRLSPAHGLHTNKIEQPDVAGDALPAEKATVVSSAAVAVFEMHQRNCAALVPTLFPRALGVLLCAGHDKGLMSLSSRPFFPVSSFLRRGSSSRMAKDEALNAGADRGRGTHREIVSFATGKA